MQEQAVKGRQPMRRSDTVKPPIQLKPPKSAHTVIQLSVSVDVLVQLDQLAQAQLEVAQAEYRALYAQYIKQQQTRRGRSAAFQVREPTSRGLLSKVANDLFQEALQARSAKAPATKPIK